MGFGKAFKGIKRLAGNLTGGLIGKSDAQRNQDRILEQQKAEAERQTRLYEKQIADETKRRREESERAAAEAQRARDEEVRLLKEQEERAKAEENFKKQIIQDSANLINNSLNHTNVKKTTTVDYSNAVNESITDDKDDDIDKLKKAFKRKL